VVRDVGADAHADFAEAWSLSFADLTWLASRPSAVRLGFAAQLMLYRRSGRFARGANDFPPEAAAYLAEQTGIRELDLTSYEWLGRSSRRHRSEILTHLGFRRPTRQDLRDAAAWAKDTLCPLGLPAGEMTERLLAWFVGEGIVSPPDAALAALVATARRAFEDHLLATIAASLSTEQKQQLDVSLEDEDRVCGFSGLKADPGSPDLANVLVHARRLAFVKSLALPVSAMPDQGDPFMRVLRRRIGNETAWRMRQHPDERRHALYAVFLAHRERELTDGLVDLLVEIVHRIGSKSRQRVIKSFTREIEHVHGKEGLLVRIAEAACLRPEGSVREVVYPAAGGAGVLAAIVREHKATGGFERRVHMVLRASYLRHYRRMLPVVLAVLEFRSNNAVHRPVLDAVDWLRRTGDDGRRVIHPEDGVPLEGVIPSKWRELVVEKHEGGGVRINRVNYEICVLTALRERLRCKEIWVPGADRYRDPDEDLPRDFAERRAGYYQALGRSEDAAAFVAGLRREMTAALRTLDANIPHNAKVRIRGHDKNRIAITPFEPLPPPPNLEAIKAELERRWPMTELIDVLMEAAQRTGFLDAFTTSGDRVVLDPDTVRRRLILCLYGLGTNAGLKRISAGTADASYAELLHIRRHCQLVAVGGEERRHAGIGRNHAAIATPVTSAQCVNAWVRVERTVAALARGGRKKTLAI